MMLKILLALGLVSAVAFATNPELDTAAAPKAPALIMVTTDVSGKTELYSVDSATEPKTETEALTLAKATFGGKDNHASVGRNSELDYVGTDAGFYWGRGRGRAQYYGGNRGYGNRAYGYNYGYGYGYGYGNGAYYGGYYGGAVGLPVYYPEPYVAYYGWQESVPIYYEPILPCGYGYNNVTIRFYRPRCDYRRCG